MSKTTSHTAPVTPTTAQTPPASGTQPTVADAAPAQPIAAVTDTAGETTVTRDAAATAGKKGTYTVAPGRTIDGKKPGETVELGADDAARMLQLGFVLDRDGAVVVQTDGPRVVQGAEIAER